METDRNLRFALLALHAGMIDHEQFIDVCSRWGEAPDRPLIDIMVERTSIGVSGKAYLEQHFESQIRGAPRDSSDAPTSFHLVSRADGPTLERPSASEPRYARQRVHATGGMGRVWLAHDTHLDRHVALKELRPEVAGDAPLTARFVQEARITGRLEHPGIVPVYEFAWSPETDQPFYTMRFVNGQTLVAASRAFHEKRRNNQAEPLELVSLLTAFVAVCNTIAYAHSHRILHRDLKGENVLLGDFGEVVVLDWGLAKSLDALEPAASMALTGHAVGVDHTVQGDIIGTPGYMAPEQAEGRLDLIDERTDIYGLGAILYEILTGQPPSTGGSTLEVIQQIVQGELPPPRVLWPAVPPALESACLKALARDTAARFVSAAELAQEVQRWQDVQRRAAEDALQRQSEILQSILDSMGEGVIVADQAGRILQINPAAERIIGTHPLDAELVNLPSDYEMLLPDRVTPCPPEQWPLRQAIQGSAVDDMELFVRLPGQPHGLWVSASGRPLKGQQGAVQGGLMVMRDISERKRVEEELRRSRERFDLAVQGSQDGLWDWDLETNGIYYSPRWKSIIGYQEHEIAPRIEEWETRLHPDERERVLAANYAHIAGQTPFYSYEYRLRHKDGSYRWILARGVALRDAKGQAYRMAGSHVDVTERRESEQALQESQQRYDAVIAMLPIGIVVLDRAGTLLTSNPNAQRILGLSADQIEGRSIFDPIWQAIHEDGSPFPATDFPAALSLRTGQPCANVVMGLRQDGAVRWLSIHSQPLFRGQEGTPYAVVVSMEDVTAFKEMAAQARASGRAARFC